MSRMAAASDALRMLRPLMSLMTSPGKKPALAAGLFSPTDKIDATRAAACSRLEVFRHIKTNSDVPACRSFLSLTMSIRSSTGDAASAAAVGERENADVAGIFGARTEVHCDQGLACFLSSLSAISADLRRLRFPWPWRW